MNRILSKLASAAALAIALVFVLGGTAQAQLAKSGKFTGHFGFYSVGQIFEIEEGHLFWVGEFTGTFFNDAGSGVMHQASTKCPSSNDIYGGVGHAQGYCIVTDSDGDKAFLSWNCEGPAGKQCDGTFDWTAGTGKYTGIQGKNTFQATFVTASEGFALWQVNYKLP
ncbi:MAG: hypothetical protein IIC82_03315 [Chloroflexi bacterium]|nr:hypothetical protein [Chloroflexota bacterium]